jgi:hypothetical protein
MDKTTVFSASWKPGFTCFSLFACLFYKKMKIFALYSLYTIRENRKTAKKRFLPSPQKTADSI